MATDILSKSATVASTYRLDETLLSSCLCTFTMEIDTVTIEPRSVLAGPSSYSDDEDDNEEINGEEGEEEEVEEPAEEVEGGDDEEVEAEEDEGEAEQGQYSS